mmetsp:Transcript_74856/g.141148  ORF Transcript_74856/g.141148 Transcript_74856/m.141148 type:complete len:102 (-) Transcript_74856:1381-1686(-)
MRPLAQNAMMTPVSLIEAPATDVETYMVKTKKEIMVMNCFITFSNFDVSCTFRRKLFIKPNTAMIKLTPPDISGLAHTRNQMVLTRAQLEANSCLSLEPNL